MFTCFTCQSSVHSMGLLMNSINPVINGFLAETNNLYGPTNDREIARCPFIRIYNGMNIAVVAIIYPVWREFETWR